MERRIRNFRDLCQEVLIIEKDAGFILRAKSYARVGLGLKSWNFIKVQILYITSNLQYWRGNKAREVKAGFKSLLKK